MLAYPQMVDFECIKTLLEILKAREVVDRKQEFCKCAWNVAGYLLYISIGDVPGSSRGVVYAHTGAMQDGLEDLEVELGDFITTLNLPGAVEPGDEPGDIGTVLMIVSVVLNLLRTLGFIKKNEE